ncbi:MAG: hypothetical protein ACXWZ4_17580 [Gemmatirosa sp.]
MAAVTVESPARALSSVRAPSPPQATSSAAAPYAPQPIVRIPPPCIVRVRPVASCARLAANIARPRARPLALVCGAMRSTSHADVLRTSRSSSYVLGATCDDFVAIAPIDDRSITEIARTSRRLAAGDRSRVHELVAFCGVYVALCA